MKRKFLNEQDREEIFEADDWTCQACGYVGTYDDLEVDHVIPLSRGGSNIAANLQTLCMTCNRQKGDLTMDEFMEGLEADYEIDEAFPVATATGGALVGFAFGGIPGALVGGFVGLLLGALAEEG